MEGTEIRGEGGWGAITNDTLSPSKTAQEVWESRAGRPGLPVPIKPDGFCERKATLKLKPSETELRSCVKVEVDVLGSSSLIVFMVSVDVKQH